MDKLLAQQPMCLLQKYVIIFLSGIRYYGIFLPQSQPIWALFLPAPEGITVGTVKKEQIYANHHAHPNWVQRCLERLHVRRCNL